MRKKIFCTGQTWAAKTEQNSHVPARQFWAKFCFMFIFSDGVSLSCNQIAYHQSRKCNIVYMCTVLTGRSGRGCGCPACLGSPRDSLSAELFMRCTLPIIFKKSVSGEAGRENR